MEFLKFIFSNFWSFLGFFLFLVTGCGLIKTLFDFIVELIHGKPVINNFYLDKDSKIETNPKASYKKKEQRVDSKASVSDADVSVRRK